MKTQNIFINHTRKRNLRAIIQIIILFIFFTHGILYYFFPQDYYNLDSNIRWIKYILVVLFAVFSLPDINIKDLFTFSIISIVCFLLMYASHDISITLMLNRLITYVAPLTLIFLAPAIQKLQLSEKSIRLLLIITIVSGLLEFFVFRGVFVSLNFTTEGYVRVATIFFNPNNAGLMFFLLIIFGLSRLTRQNFLYYSILFLLSLVVIFFTGSRTVLVILSISILLLMANNILKIEYYIKKRIIGIVFFTLIALSLFSFYQVFSLENKAEISQNTRDLKIDTFSERFDQYILFISKIKKDLLVPDYFTFDFTYDNAYLQYWSDFSLIGFLFFTFFLIYRFLKIKGQDKVALFGMLVSGLSINIFYIWPTAYIVYYLLLKKNINQS